MTRWLALLPAAFCLLALSACESAFDDCQKAHPADQAAAAACFQAVLQRQNAQLNRYHAEEFRGRN
jgi:uncharacterized protein YecT (DUF1311 family)